MSTTHERVDGVIEAQRDDLRAILDRQREAFVKEGVETVAPAGESLPDRATRKINAATRSPRVHPSSCATSTSR